MVMPMEKRNGMDMMSLGMMGIIALVAIVGMAMMVFNARVAAPAAVVPIQPVTQYAAEFPESASGAVARPDLDPTVPGRSESAGKSLKEMGSFCTRDSQCASGQCVGVYFVPSGKAVPGIRVCT